MNQYVNKLMNDLDIGNTFLDDDFDICRQFIDAHLRKRGVISENVGTKSVGLSFGEVVCSRPFRAGRRTGNVGSVKGPAVVEKFGEI